MKKIKYLTRCLIVIVSVLLCNQIYYLSKLQFVCRDKIDNGEDLNSYETLSALQTHTAFWMFGWVVSKPTAITCFEKQFHTRLFIHPDFNDNELVKKAKSKIKKNKSKKIRLAWKSYKDPTSIYLNGAYISYFVDDEVPYYRYDVPVDYKPGTISICGITLCETVFDYLENKGILEVYNKTEYQRYK